MMSASHSVGITEREISGMFIGRCNIAKHLHLNTDQNRVYLQPTPLFLDFIQELEHLGVQIDYIKL